MLMLVDSRDESPAGNTREPWYITALASMFPWPAIIAWLFVASQVLGGWWSVLTLWLGIMLFSWRGLRKLPADGGMRDYRQ
jgi:hypothetical protein